MVVLVCSVFIAGVSSPTCDSSTRRASVSDVSDQDPDERMEKWRKQQAIRGIFRTVMRQPKSPVPIIYDDRLSSWPLTQTHTNRVLRRAAEACPDGQETWFVLVRDNYVYDWEVHVIATIYFTPYAETPRIRKGWCAIYADLSRELRRTPEKQTADADRNGRRFLRLPPQWKYTGVSEYWQISLPDRPFGEHLEIPTRTLWPLEPPRGFTEQEVIAIVDVIRASPRVGARGDSQDAKPGAVSGSFPERVDGQLPILSIERLPAGIVVRTGSLQGPLDGSGQRVLLRRKGGPFVVVSVSMWAS